jgi:hypothetical protein
MVSAIATKVAAKHCSKLFIHVLRGAERAVTLPLIFKNKSRRGGESE